MFEQKTIHHKIKKKSFLFKAVKKGRVIIILLFQVVLQGSRKKSNFLMVQPLWSSPPLELSFELQSRKKVLFSQWSAPTPPPLLVVRPLKKELFCGFPQHLLHFITYGKKIKKPKRGGGGIINLVYLKSCSDDIPLFFNIW